jgi:hypothetical protein
VAVTAIVVAGCGSSSSPVLPGGLPTSSDGGNGAGNGGGNGGNSLAQGLSSNLDNLDSYKFTYTIEAGSSADATSSGLTISGTVVNKPTKAVLVDDLGVKMIAIGDKSWSSFDGTTWMVSDSGSSGVYDLLPSKNYGSWFDMGSSKFNAAGDETKNGVPCTHFKGDQSLANQYSTLGVASAFNAELWVSKDGNYPISGVFTFTATAGGKTGAYGYKFDITNINDKANVITTPNV